MQGTIPGFLGELKERSCPTCGSVDDSVIFAEERINIAALGKHAFSSRKRPEHMRLRLVSCPVCDLAYASPIPAPEALAGAYDDAAFDSAEEARYAAATYAHALQSLVPTLPDRCGALDVGTGEGAFLSELLRLGFTDVVGIEPSRAPIEAADPAVATLIEHDVFRQSIRPAGSLSLVTCFQTIEHIPDPAKFAREAAALLRPGGLLVLVCHNRRAPINRLLGMRSPIIDIEHMQLFSPRSITELLRRAGLHDVGHRTLRNSYPIRYWTRLLPLPSRPQALLEDGLGRLGRWPLTLNVGNLLAWGRR